MIELFYHTTPNARKVLIMLGEVAAEYKVVWVDITKGEQFSEAFRAVNPNAKVPAILDHDGPGGQPFALFESGAILVYLAEKFGRLLPAEPRARHRALAWVFWQVGGQGPMSGQAAHFISHAPKAGIDNPYGQERYLGETKRHYDVLDAALGARAWLAGDEYTIADIAAFPWTRVARGHGVTLDDYPNVKRWSDAVAARPAAQVRPEAEAGRPRPQGTQGYDREQWDILFGKGQRQLAAQPGTAT